MKQIIGAVMMVSAIILAGCGGGGSSALVAQPDPRPAPQGDVQVLYNLPGVANGLTQAVPRRIANSPSNKNFPPVARLV